MTLNRWSVKADIWTESRLLKHKHLSLQLAFSMVIGLIDASKWPNISVKAPEYQDLVKRVKADYRSLQFTASSQSFWLSWEGLHTRSMQLAGLLAYILRSSGIEDVPRSDMLSFFNVPAQRSKVCPPLSLSRSPSPATLVPLPKSPSCAPRTTIPLLENFSESGLRSQTDAWQKWYTERTRELVDSIEDGEWYGYYVYTLGDKDSTHSMGKCDPAMENIHFKVGGSGSGKQAASASMSGNSGSPTATWSGGAASSVSKVSLEARGCRDGVLAEFDFEGTAHAGTGVVEMCKSYHGAHSWDYEGVITPLGIIGEWGREGTGFSGYFWLWKRNWMADDLAHKSLVYYS